MAVQPKKPDKPGYMTTEFWAILGTVAYALFGNSGISPEQIQAAANNWVSELGNLLSGGNASVKLIVIGFLVWGYGKWRTSLKKTKIISETKIAAIGGKPDAS